MAPKTLEKAWEGAKTVQNWWDPFDVLAAGTAHTIEAMVPTTKEEMFIDLVGMARGGPIKYYGTKAGTKLLKGLTSLGIKGLDDTAGLTPALVDGAQFGKDFIKRSTASTVKPGNPLAISKATTTISKQVARTAGGEPIYEQKQARTKQPKGKGKSEVPVDERVYVSDIPRRETEMPPTAELIKYAEEQGIPVEFAEKFAKDSVRTFNQQRKFARLASQQRTPGQVDVKGDSDAGHYLAAKTESAQHLADEPGKRLHTPPTHGDTARPQARIENRLNKPEDHINLHIADSVGIHTTWAKKLKAAWDVENGIHIFNFKADLSLKGQEAMLNIPTNLPRSQAIKARDAILADPSNLSNNLSKHDMRDILIDNARNDLDLYTTD